MNEQAPIALFVYNRPRHTMDTIKALTKNYNFKHSKLFVFSDECKENCNDDFKKVKEVREIIRRIKGAKEITLIEQPENRGLAFSIINGVSKVLEDHEKIIVLEDDIFTSKGFLNFMNNGLNLYKDVDKVMHVSGYVYPVNVSLPSNFFYRVPSCWGWGTWKSSWDKLERDPSRILSKLKELGLTNEFDLGGTKVFLPQLTGNIEGLIKTWAILWYGTVFLNQGLCLHPGKSLVRNIGHDGTGEHCGSDKVYMKQRIVNHIDVAFTSIEESEVLVKEMKKFYRYKGNGQLKHYTKIILNSIFKD